MTTHQLIKYPPKPVLKKPVVASYMDVGSKTPAPGPDVGQKYAASHASALRLSHKMGGPSVHSLSGYPRALAGVPYASSVAAASVPSQSQAAKVRARAPTAAAPARPRPGAVQVQAGQVQVPVQVTQVMVRPG